MSACHFCGATLDPKMRIVRDTVCPQCGRDLHACVQGRHYDRHAHNHSREPQAEWGTDRERRNYCDYFGLNPAGGKGAGVPDREKAARSKLDALFGPGGAKPGPDAARSKLDSLFQKPAVPPKPAATPKPAVTPKPAATPKPTPQDPEPDDE